MEGTTTNQASPYPLRMPMKLREFFEAKARDLDRSLHWVLVKTLQDAAASEENAG